MWDLRDNVKYAKPPHERIPEEERKKGIKMWFEELVAENFSNLQKETDI